MGTALIYILAILFIGSFIYIHKREQKRFNEKFPPISDAEFIARCKAGTDPKVALKVRKIIADNLGIEYERIYPETRFIEDLGRD